MPALARRATARLELRPRTLASERHSRELECLPAQDARLEALAWLTLIHPDDSPLLNAAMAAHLEGETAHQECEHRMRHKNGRSIRVHGRAEVIERDAGGAPYQAKKQRRKRVGLNACRQPRIKSSSTRHRCRFYAAMPRR